MGIVIEGNFVATPIRLLALLKLILLNFSVAELIHVSLKDLVVVGVYAVAEERATYYHLVIVNHVYVEQLPLFLVLFADEILFLEFGENSGLDLKVLNVFVQAANFDVLLILGVAVRLNDLLHN